MSDPTIDANQKDRTDDPGDQPGWRVEGVDEKSKSTRSKWFPPLERRTFWISVSCLLLANWIWAPVFSLSESGVGFCSFVIEGRVVAGLWAWFGLTTPPAPRP